MFRFFKKNKNKNNSGTIIVKTNEQKIMEQKEQERKMGYINFMVKSN